MLLGSPPPQQPWRWAPLVRRTRYPPPVRWPTCWLALPRAIPRARHDPRSPGARCLAGGAARFGGRRHEQRQDVPDRHLDPPVDAGGEQRGPVEVTGGGEDRDREGHRLEEAEQGPQRMF